MIIVLVGKAGSGKSTVSEYLFKKYGMEVVRFSDALKEIAMEMGFTHKQVYGSQENKEEINKLWNVSGRTFLQRFGTEFGRNYVNKLFPEAKMGNNLWVRLLENELDDNVVVEDCRFPNEAKVLRDRNAVFIKLERNTKYTNNHASETELDSIVCDYVINNNKTFGDLFHQIDNIVRDNKITVNTNNNETPSNNDFLTDDLFAGLLFMMFIATYLFLLL